MEIPDTEQAGDMPAQCSGYGSYSPMNQTLHGHGGHGGHGVHGGAGGLVDDLDDPSFMSPPGLSGRNSLASSPLDGRIGLLYGGHGGGRSSSS